MVQIILVDISLSRLIDDLDWKPKNGAELVCWRVAIRISNILGKTSDIYEVSHSASVLIGMKLSCHMILI